MTSDFISQLHAKAASLHRRIVFPDSSDPRTVSAAKILLSREIAHPVLVGSPERIAEAARKAGEDPDALEIVDPASSPHRQSFIDETMEVRKEKGITREEAESMMRHPLFFAAMMIRRKLADGSVAGSLSTTGDVLRAGIQILGLSHGTGIVSSFFLIVFPEKIFSFADCAVVPDPTDEQLAEIALATAASHRKITGEEPVVAFLSYSTRGSADHPKVRKVQNAVRIAASRRNDIIMDGELQLDAAIHPPTAARKAGGSPAAGKANVLIFPDLDSGNIGYKMAQRFGGAEAIGPLVQGLSQPFFDLSRGCSVNDIVHVAAVNALMAGKD